MASTLATAPALGWIWKIDRHRGAFVRAGEAFTERIEPAAWRAGGKAHANRSRLRQRSRTAAERAQRRDTARDQASGSDDNGHWQTALEVALRRFVRQEPIGDGEEAGRVLHIRIMP